MRVLALIFMTLAFIVGGGSAAVLFKNIDNRMGTDGDSKKTEQVYVILENAQKEIDELKKQGIDVTKIDDPQVKESLDIMEKTPAKWKVVYAGKLGILLAVISFVMVVVAFMKKELVTKLSIGVVILALVVWASTPYIEAGTFSGANPKSIALIALIALTISSACAFLSYKLYLKKKSRASN